jgi:hypothetical protein
MPLKDVASGGNALRNPIELGEIIQITNRFLIPMD